MLYCFLSGTKYSASEFIQYRLPVGCGPSSKTCPRCPPHLSRTSTRGSPGILSSSFKTKASGRIGAQNDGQPVPESYFCSERKTGSLHPALKYVPFLFSYSSAPVKGISVPAS